MRKLLLLLITLFVFDSWSNAQDSVRTTLLRLRDVYQKSPFLSFSVRYEYAAESNPNQVLDSAVGSYVINGTNVWSLVDSTETVSDGKLLIVAYHLDRRLFVDKPEPSEATPAIAGIESLLSKTETYSVRFSGAHALTLAFLDDPVYQSAVLQFDPQTFFIQQLTYVLHARAGEEQEARSLVRLVFTGYSTQPVTLDRFSTKRFVEKNKDGYKGMGAYGEYEVFLGSSKLLN